MSQLQPVITAMETALPKIVGHDLSTLMPMIDAFQSLAKIKAQNLADDECRRLGSRGVEYINGLIESSSIDESSVIPILAQVVGALHRLRKGGDPSTLELPAAFAPTQTEHKHVERQAAAMQILGLPEHVDRALFSDFVIRQESALSDVESRLLTWEKTPRESLLVEIRGLVHTLKGEAGALGLDDLERLSHAFEDLLLTRPVPQGIADQALGVVDWVRAFLAWCGGRRTQAPVSAASLIEKLNACKNGPAEQHNSDDLMPSEVHIKKEDQGLEFSRDPKELADFISESREHLEQGDICLLDLEGDNAVQESLDGLFRSLHTIKGLSGFFGANLIQKVAHDAETILDKARKAELPLIGEALDLIFDAVEIIRKELVEFERFITEGVEPKPQSDPTIFHARVEAVLSGKANLSDEPIAHPNAALSAASLTSALLATGAIRREDLTAALKKQGVEENKADATTVAKALVAQGVATVRQMAQAMRQVRQGEAKVQVKEAIKVDAERLDTLINLIGEMVIAQTMVSQAPELKQALSVQTAASLAQVEKLTRELQGMGTALRMVPIRGTFQRMARLVRDLGKKLDKQVELVTVGDETELDKNVVDAIGDPLVHMVRNSLDHGLEDTAEREKSGKNAKGRVELKAYHKGGSIHIEITDDGRGLDRARILAKAREKGLIGASEEPSDRDLWQVIFRPGFSTAAEVTEVSGRGVGMDVVKRAIDALRGNVDISSTLGKGTTFTIRLPLTMAVIDGMVIKVGTERYIIPTLSIVSTLRPKPEELSNCLSRGHMLRWHGHLLPLWKLVDLFESPRDKHDESRELVVILEDDGKHVAVQIDDLLGQQQVVIKSLGASFKDIKGISGGAILPDGLIGLIVDVAGLVRLAQTTHIGGDPPKLE